MVPVERVGRAQGWIQAFHSLHFMPNFPEIWTRPASSVGKAPDLILGGLGFESDSRRSCSGGRFRPSVCEAVGAINASPKQRTELFPATTRGQKPRWSYLLGLHPHYLGLHPHYSGVRRMTSIHPHYSGVRMKTSRSILTTPGHPHLSGQPKKHKNKNKNKNKKSLLPDSYPALVH